MISIIIPTFSEEKYVPRLLDDLSKQTVQNFEVIVVYGRSTDRTVAVVRKLQENMNIRMLISPLRRISIQRNMGVAKSQGTMLMFLDAEVTLRNRYFISHARSHLKSCIGAFARIDADPTEARLRDRAMSSAIHAAIQATYDLGWVSARGACQIVRREDFFRIEGFNEFLVAGEDNELFRQLAKVGRVTILPVRAYESPRRYRTQGYAKTMARWMLNHTWYKAVKNSYSRSWYAVR